VIHRSFSQSANQSKRIIAPYTANQRVISYSYGIIMIPE